MSSSPQQRWRNGGSAPEDAGLALQRTDEGKRQCMPVSVLTFGTTADRRRTTMIPDRRIMTPTAPTTMLPAPLLNIRLCCLALMSTVGFNNYRVGIVLDRV